MRQQTKFTLFLASCLLLTAFAGCGKKQTDSSTEIPPIDDSSFVEELDSENALVEEETISSSEEKIVITVDTVEVTLDELKEQNYVVPLYVTLEKNAGVTYSEWGLSYDERCKMTADTDQLNYSTVYAFSSNNPFLWTAWSGGSQIFTYESPILRLYMRLPEDAMVGDFYAVNYESISQANMPHKWSDGKNNWVAMNAVSWNDGGVRVVVSAD